MTAARAAQRRLKRKTLIADPYRGFHVIVPPAYRRLGCLPADQFIPDLMSHLGTAYPVALAPWKKMNGFQRDPRWNVAENIEVVPDL